MFIDESFEEHHGFGHQIVHKLFYAYTGLQNLFNLKGLKLHFNFEVVALERLGYKTYPSVQNLRYERYVISIKSIEAKDYID